MIILPEDKTIIALLSAEDAKQVLLALFSEEGELPVLSPLANMAYTAVKTKSDRISDKKSKTGKLGGAPKNNQNAKKQPKQPKQPNDEKTTETTHRTSTVSDTVTVSVTVPSTPHKPPKGGPDFGKELQSAFDSWLAYKAEKRDAYKPTGLQALKTEVRHNADRYGEAAVAALIRECMGNNWKGIIFDRLKGQKTRDAPADRRKSATEEERNAVEELRRMMEEG